ncbi:MipA/OmpV family protein [Rhizobium sp. BK379]|uniref:MipA/OmpV family protein n=1 Tax=Rhizobium sp. BK379 TaxID=2587059 RepID=UPI000DD7F837|nr:MipA/OmpV family protein [Rhizobium sp. BK379]MBB3443982.1 outer membrane scaffolding protein for murein synthesis (MipA/OmpV family) [Rhizobium sp. BK379]
MFRKFFSKSAARGSLPIAVAIALMPSLVQAADPSQSSDQAAIPPMPDPERFGPVRQKLHDWEVMVGAGVMFQPKYEGSDEMEISPLPFVSATFFDRLTIDPTGVELTAYERGPFQFDVKVGYDFGRNEDDSDDLRGMGDIDGGVTVGGKATWSYGPAEFFVSVDKTIGGSDGLLGTVGVEVTRPVNEKLILGAGASATFADKNYMESYFGVTAAQAARSGYDAYKPGSGVKNIDLSVSATYMFHENWMVRAEQDVGFLVGDAADSPLVKQKVQPKSMLVLGYRF